MKLIEILIESAGKPIPIKSKSKIPDLDSYDYGRHTKPELAGHPIYKKPGPIFHKAGITLYHGTTVDNAMKIMKSGLQPRPVKHENTIFHQWRTVYGIDTPLPPGIRAIYMGQDLDEVRSWHQPVIFGFVTNEQDILAGPQYSDAETLVLNKISPKRLSIIRASEETRRKLELLEHN